MHENTTDMAADEPLYIDSEAELESITATEDVVLVDFYADWCGPCQMLEPIVETLASETEATVVKVDVDANQKLAARFGVRGVPTMALFAAGEQVEQIVGLRSQQELRSTIADYAA